MKKVLDTFIEEYPQTLSEEFCDYFIKFFEYEHFVRRTKKGGIGSGGGVNTNYKDSYDLLPDTWWYNCDDALRTGVFKDKNECEYHDRALNEVLYSVEERMVEYIHKYFWLDETDYRQLARMFFNRDNLIPSDILNTQKWERFKTQQHLFHDGIFDFQLPELGHNGGMIMKRYTVEDKQGYHLWHWDHGHSMDQILRRYVCMFYLNDVEEGGETEWYWQNVKIKPKKGSLVIFPAFETHIHKGHIPISNNKYILNLWLTQRLNYDEFSKYYKAKKKL